MKIFYENVNAVSPEAYQELRQYDKDSSPDDGVLDNFELGLLPGLMQQLTKFCVGIVGKGESADEFETVAVWAGQCAPAEPAPIKTSNTTPNGKVYPGVIIDVPGGEFEMGTVCDGRHGYDGGTHDPDEHTRDGKTVRVKISDFRMAKTEVTIGQYVHYRMERYGESEAEARSHLPSDWAGNNKKGDDFPIVALTFTEKMYFAKYYGGTLPSAAQNEYASKGPSHNDLYGTPIDKAIIASNGATTTAEVAGPNDERCNGFGLCDLAGNVLETTSDGYDSDSYDDSMSINDPTNSYKAGLLEFVEYRGGSFFNFAWYARAANRFVLPDDRYNRDGFRCVWPQGS